MKLYDKFFVYGQMFFFFFWEKFLIIHHILNEVQIYTKNNKTK